MKARKSSWESYRKYFQWVFDPWKNKSYERKVMAESNGKYTALWRIVEGLAIAGIVGGLSIFGTTKVLETKLDNLCQTVTKLEGSLNTINAELDHQTTGAAEREARIIALEREVFGKGGKSKE